MGDPTDEEEMTARKAITEFLEEEIGGYSLDWEIEEQGTDQYLVSIWRRHDTDKKQVLIVFRYRDDDLEIELCEDNWQVVRDYDWTVKYFWMAFLKWRI